MPLAYVFATRLGGWSARVSWAFIYPMPVLLSALLYRVDVVTPEELLALLLAMLSVYALYEVGYMDNDTRTAAMETAPTERLSDREKKHFLDRYWFILTLRIAFVASSVIAIDWLIEDNETGKRLYTAGLLMIALVFPIYNSLRGRLGLPLHFLLVTARFVAPGLVLVQLDFVQYIVVMILLFPVINLLERSGELRYGISRMHIFHAKRDLLRFFYYTGLVVLGCSAWIAGWVGTQVVVLFTWFFVYRTISFLLSNMLRGST